MPPDIGRSPHLLENGLFLVNHDGQFEVESALLDLSRKSLDNRHDLTIDAIVHLAYASRFTAARN